MPYKSCFFIGHREAGPEILPALEDAIEKHISEYGVTEFIVGHYGSFDRLAARALVSAKKRHPDVKLLMLIPYHPAERPIETPTSFDGTFYPQGMESVPRKFAIVQANRYIIDHADYLIAFVWHPASNAQKLLEYATQKAIKGAIRITVIPKLNTPNTPPF